VQRRHLFGILLALSVGSAVAAGWLLLHNPTVASTSLGHYTCSAPYDTVLNDADNVPGGEPPPDADEVEASCLESAQSRFLWGSVSVAAGAMFAVGAGVTRRMSPDRRILSS